MNSMAVLMQSTTDLNAEGAKQSQQVQAADYIAVDQEVGNMTSIERDLEAGPPPNLTDRDRLWVY